ncbi:MAG: hypothetical protein ABSG30_12880 [Steroidobacteraceae bacterium]|jgi:hypothetical protein
MTAATSKANPLGIHMETIGPDGEHLQFADNFHEALTLALAPPDPLGPSRR